ncbi:MAG: nucleotidyltransferase domain-containing protein [Anaerolineae bacterium]|nr:nucleotidyltransferase domain-containing protein [Anaerolineae bacterium]
MEDTNAIAIANSSLERVGRAPATVALLCQANLSVHAGVARVLLVGSRGLAGGHRPDSDVDLSLIVDMALLAPRDPERVRYLRAVLHTTQAHWRGPVEADLAAVFDINGCGLRCLDDGAGYIPDQCPRGGVDCFGVYKVQRGFDGYVTGPGLDVRRMYPYLTPWCRDDA